MKKSRLFGALCGCVFVCQSINTAESASVTYTNETDFITYIPSLPFVNIKLDRQLQPAPSVALNTWSTTDKFTNTPGEYDPDYAIDLQWVVGLDTGTGLKIINLNNTGGVSAIQTSQKPAPVPPVELEYPNDKGTLRIYRLVVAP